MGELIGHFFEPHPAFTQCLRMSIFSALPQLCRKCRKIVTLRHLSNCRNGVAIATGVTVLFDKIRCDICDKKG